MAKRSDTAMNMALVYARRDDKEREESQYFWTLRCCRNDTNNKRCPDRGEKRE
jgi:hypothetical protein